MRPRCTRDVELGAGFGETEKGIAAITTDIAAGAGTDLAPGDVAADVVLRSVGVQRDFGSVEHHQQLGLVGFEPREEGDEAGLALEDAVEPRPQCCLALFGGAATIGLEITVEVQDQFARGALGGAILVGEGVELVNQTLGMNPTQAVLADVELTGVVADDHGVREEAVRRDAAPQRRLGGDHHAVWIDLEGRDAERFEKAKAAEGAVATARELLEQLTKIGFANMQDYMRVGPDGDPVLNFANLTRDQAAALQEVTVESYVDGAGEDAREVKKVRFKLADKRAALVDLGRHYKLLTDKFKHGGKDGGPIEGKITVEFVSPPNRKK